MTFFKRRRLLAGKMQSDLVKELGVSQATISSWECGRFFPNAHQLPAIAQALDCTMDELLEALTEMQSARR